MIDHLVDARSHVAASKYSGYSGTEIPLLRDALRALIQWAEDTDRRLTQIEQRLTRIEEPDRPPSGLMPTMGDEEPRDLRN